MRDFHARVAKQIMNVALATPERWAHQVKKATEAGYLDPNITTTYEEMKKFVAEGNYTKTVPNERHIQLEVGTFAASSYFSARLDTAQGTGRFGWLHYFRSPSLPYDGRPETSSSPLKNVESSAFFVFLSSNSWGDRVVVSAVG